MTRLPFGTTTFLFTDIEGSTRLVLDLGQRYADLLAAHRRLLRAAFEEHGGEEVDVQGDAQFHAFPQAKAALDAAIAAQRAVAGHAWPGEATVRVRIGLHTGEPIYTDTGYVGMDVHRAARICAAGHGGQILLSQTTRDLLAQALPPDVSLRDMGEHRLKDLPEPEHLYQVVAPDLITDFAPPKSLGGFPNNLPAPLTSFIGREREMVEVKRLLPHTRLLTLIGTGGSGKTRLALQIASDVLGDYPAGVWWVELAPIADPSLVPQAIASALGLREQPGRPLKETLIDYLRPKRSLLVLDNCEHLLSGVAETADPLLQSCPNVQIMATSRAPLGVRGELEWRVPSLSIPDLKQIPPIEALIEFESVRLFVNRAALVLPSFTLTDHNARSIGEVCHQLDGIPLALEMAAARVKMLSVGQIAERLDDRFRLLTKGSRTGLPRHQTLRATLDWSHDLLLESERALLRRLSVFSGGFTLEAAEAVCRDETVGEFEVLDLLTNLVDKSLILAEEHERELRYRFLETVRQYSREKLDGMGEAETVRDRHRNFFLAMAEEAEPLLTGREEVTWLNRLEMEHDNMRATLAWSVEKYNGEALLRLAGSLGWFWFERGYFSEGRGWLEQALEIGREASPRARAQALYKASVLAHSQNDFVQAAPMAEQSLALSIELKDDRGRARALYIIGTIARFRGDYVTASSRLQDCLTIFRKLNDKWGAASALRQLAQAAIKHERYDEGNTLLEESLALYREAGYRRGIAYALHQLAIIAHSRGDQLRATTLLEESQALFQEVGDRHGRAYALSLLGKVLGSCGDEERALALLKKSLEIQRELGAKLGVAESLIHLAILVASSGEAARACRLFGAAEALRDSLGIQRNPHDATVLNRTLGMLRVGMNEDALQRTWAEGRAMSFEEAVEYALSELGMKHAPSE